MTWSRAAIEASIVARRLHAKGKAKKELYHVTTVRGIGGGVTKAYSRVLTPRQEQYRQSSITIGSKAWKSRESNPKRWEAKYGTKYKST